MGSAALGVFQKTESVLGGTMDHGGLGGALSEGTSGDWSPQESKAILPSSRTFVNVGVGFPQPHGLEHTWINVLFVEQLLQKSEDLGASGDHRMLLSPGRYQPCGALRSEPPRSPPLMWM